MKKQIGVIGVDAGLCWIGDPCYILGKDATEQPTETWSEFCDLLGDKFNKDGHKQFNYKMGHEGLGVLVSTGYGDGVYPVYAEFKDGRVSKVTIEFI